MARSRSLVSALCTVILCWYAEGVTIESSVLKGTVNQVTNCMFEGNECTGSGCGGGAMLIYTDSIVGKIDQTTFKANIARGSAGGGAKVSH